MQRTKVGACCRLRISKEAVQVQQSGPGIDNERWLLSLSMYRETSAFTESGKRSSGRVASRKGTRSHVC
jgi:hypothetical protein